MGYLEVFPLHVAADVVRKLDAKVITVEVAFLQPFRNSLDHVPVSHYGIMSNEKSRPVGLKIFGHVSTISIWIADDANCARSVEYSLADCGRDHGRTSVRLPYWR